MPKEYIDCGEIETVRVGWSKSPQGYVEIATIWESPEYKVCVWNSSKKEYVPCELSLDQGWFVPLDEESIDKLIKVLQKAKRKAFK